MPPFSFLRSPAGVARSSRERQQADIDPEGRSSAGGTAGEDQTSVLSTPTDLHNNERVALRILAGRESKASSYLRVFVLCLLLLSAILISYYGYVLTRNEQNNTFESYFKGFASDLITKFHLSVENNLQGIDSLAIAITAHALRTNSTFPFVTLPNFEVIAGNTRVLSWSFYFTYAPLVRKDQLEAWERYAWENRQQFLNSIEADSLQIAIQDQSVDGSGVRLEDCSQLNLSDYVFNFSGARLDRERPPAGASGPLLPLWHQSPAVPYASAFNFNILSHPLGREMRRESIRTGMAALDSAVTLQGLDKVTTSTYLRLLFSRSQYRHNARFVPDSKITPILDDPITPMTYPVFDSFDPKTRRVSGLLDTGIQCVITNAFNQTLTYEINGEKSSYLGNEDVHDNEFEYLAQSVDLNEHLSNFAAERTKSYTSVDLSSFSGYRVSVYPSKETKKEFTNSDPIRNAVVIIGVFVFVSTVFLCYDLHVRRHRKIVTDRAVASGAIVSSLFPSLVREKIYQKETSLSSHRPTLRDFFEHNRKEPSIVMANDVIAESFEETTIMFADISGFTAWSKCRTPNQVFCLLETLFQAFDEIALRRKVFKVETIGDCYVAVSGLPHPQKKHAVTMVEFASECLTTMRELVVSLSASLGSDTSSLELRIGLHSGPVTGGVLRGQKSRFQLFGSTMNQASRTESTGAPGRIQVSSESAVELMQYDKECWLSEREDKVEAKGLGCLTTYWVAVDFVAPNITSSSPIHQEVYLSDTVGGTCQL